MTDIKAAAAVYFSNNPGTDVLFFTANGNMFTDRSKAEGHASRLRDRQITTLYHPRFTKGEITQMQAAEKSKQIAGAQAAFTRAMPELAASIQKIAKLKSNGRMQKSHRSKS